jgi:hypothetical protein
MSVPFNSPFDPFYDTFSIHEADFVMPAHFSVFVPDNQDDYKCVSVISPSVFKGSTSWTLNEKWITIGIYRDEGRSTTQRQPLTNLSWTRVGRTITINVPNGHKLHSGDIINVSNVNVTSMPNVTVNVIDPYNFSFTGLAMQPSSGSNASFQDAFLTNFYENYRVFRLLPSFQLVPYSTIIAIFAQTAPIPQSNLKTLYNINTLQTVMVPSSNDDSIDYLSPTITLPPSVTYPLAIRFGQAYDAKGNPLKLSYLPTGFPTQVINVDSPNSNDQIFYNPPINQTSDPYVYAYDFYGIEMNDVNRGPTYSTSNVTRNSSIAGSLNNISISAAIGYTSTVNDVFGNLAIGIQDNNALVVRKQILPLALNYFNQPTKKPVN